MDWEKDAINFVSPRCTMTCAPCPTKAMTMDIPSAQLWAMNIATVSLTGFWKTVRKEKCLHDSATTFANSTADINAMLENPDQDRTPDIPKE